MEIQRYYSDQCAGRRVVGLTVYVHSIWHRGQINWQEVVKNDNGVKYGKEIVGGFRTALLGVDDYDNQLYEIRNIREKYTALNQVPVLIESKGNWMLGQWHMRAFPKEIHIPDDADVAVAVTVDEYFDKVLNRRGNEIIGMSKGVQRG